MVHRQEIDIALKVDAHGDGFLTSKYPLDQTTINSLASLFMLKRTRSSGQGTPSPGERSSTSRMSHASSAGTSSKERRSVKSIFGDEHEKNDDGDGEEYDAHDHPQEEDEDD